MDNFQYRYKAFGFNITSDFPLEGLLPSDGPPEVFIREGRVSVAMPESGGAHAYTVLENNGFAFRIEDIGTFVITGGNLIVFERHHNCDEDSFILYILGTCMGALFMQRGMLPIHGSALELEGKHIIITGESGAGKSTLAATLNQRGYSFLADDIAALGEEEGSGFHIFPAFPRQKLWRDTAERLYGNVDTLSRIPGIRDKYHVSMEGRFITEPRQPDALFELTVHSGKEVVVSPVNGPDKLMLILRNVYRPELIDFLGKQPEYFLKCSRLASSLPVFHIERPVGQFSTNEQINAILACIKQLSIK